MLSETSADEGSPQGQRGGQELEPPSSSRRSPQPRDPNESSVSSPLTDQSQPTGHLEAVTAPTAGKTFAEFSMSLDADKVLRKAKIHKELKKKYLKSDISSRLAEQGLNEFNEELKKKEVENIQLRCYANYLISESNQRVIKINSLAERLKEHEKENIQKKKKERLDNIVTFITDLSDQTDITNILFASVFATRVRENLGPDDLAKAGLAYDTPFAKICLDKTFKRLGGVIEGEDNEASTADSSRASTSVATKRKLSKARRQQKVAAEHSAVALGIYNSEGKHPYDTDKDRDSLWREHGLYRVYIKKLQTKRNNFACQIRNVLSAYLQELQYFADANASSVEHLDKLAKACIGNRGMEDISDYEIVLPVLRSTMFFEKVGRYSVFRDSSDESRTYGLKDVHKTDRILFTDDAKRALHQKQYLSAMITPSTEAFVLLVILKQLVTDCPEDWDWRTKYPELVGVIHPFHLRGGKDAYPPHTIQWFIDARTNIMKHRAQEKKEETKDKFGYIEFPELYAANDGKRPGDDPVVTRPTKQARLENSVQPMQIVLADC